MKPNLERAFKIYTCIFIYLLSRPFRNKLYYIIHVILNINKINVYIEINEDFESLNYWLSSFCRMELISVTVS